MNEKLKKITIKLEDLIKKFDSLQDLYFKLKKITVSQSDYFSHLGPNNLIKLAIYIYSYKMTKGFDMADKIINNLSFAEFAIPSEQQYLKTCKECEGEAWVNCKYCGGTNEIECTECEGYGEVASGYEMVDCKECYGGGVVKCDTCDMYGTIECSECDGIGEIETNEIVVRFAFIATWSKRIKDQCELNVGTNIPIMSEDEFLSLESEFIRLSSGEGHQILDVEPYQMYCLSYSDEPAITLHPQSMNILPTNKTKNAEYWK
jgi:hypothetical protein